MRLLEYVTHLGYEPRQINTQRSQMCCPLHHDSHPSFVIYHETESWYCFGCQTGGTLFSLIWRLEFPDTTGAEVAKQVEDRMHALGASRDRRQYLAPHKVKPGPAVQQQRCLDLALRHYKQVLSQHPRALAYLRQRGIPDPLRLDLGYCSGQGSEFTQLAQQLRVELGNDWRAIALECGLIWEDGAERLGERIVIAERRQGHVIFYQGRSLDPLATRRYLNPRGIRKPLFGLETMAWDYPAVVFVEGPFDALPLHARGIPAVALLGSNIDNLLEFTHRLRARPVLIATDADEAGEALAYNLAEELRSIQHATIRLSPEPCKDLGEWASHAGGEWLEYMVRSVIPRAANVSVARPNLRPHREQAAAQSAPTRLLVPHTPADSAATGAPTAAPVSAAVA